MISDQTIDTNQDELRLLAKLAAAANISVYLVGGYVRDQLLQRQSADFDIVTSADPTKLARQFATQIDAYWFPIDSERNYSRVVMRGDSAQQFDFAPLRGATIETDLVLRDFTINAIAVKLQHHPLHIQNSVTIDPTAGINDLHARCLRMCADASFVDDPLRILKGIRHCAQLQFIPDSNTLQAFRQHAHLLTKVSGERIRNEFALLLAAPYATQGIQLLYDGDIATYLGIEGDASHISASFTAIMDKLTPIVDDKSHPLHEIFIEACGDNFTLKTALLFADILMSCDINTDAVRQLIAGLHFNKNLTKLLTFASTVSTQQLETYFQLQCSARGRLLWLQIYGVPLAQALCVIAILHNTTFNGEALVNALCQLEQLKQDGQITVVGKIAPLLSAAQVHQHYPQCIGAHLGEFFRQLTDAEINGIVNSPDQAVEYLHHWHETN